MFSTSTGMAHLDARADFGRARRSARLARALRRRSAAEPPTLVDGARRRAAERGNRVVPLASIVGTVEPSPHFDARFRPASEHLRARWERVALAHRRGIALPPVLVVEGGDGYYVLDGRHRVSVALATGHHDIEVRIS
jgi:hypothetical protein